MAQIRSTVALGSLFAVLLLVNATAHAATVRPTNLLFSFVTGTSGFDTSLIISNTSADPLGTDPVSGTCTLSFFGTNAPADFTTPTIGAGVTHGIIASSVAPGFQGYVFAVCQFPFAHGTAFVSDLGARNLLAAYPALIVPKNRHRNGESLEN